MERSLRSVMAQYGAGDLPSTALLPSYRCLRRRRPNEGNQAVAVTTTDSSYKIMLDVREFAEGSLSVRAVGENELVIEGVVESTQSDVSEGCRSSKSASRKFQQRFMFPDLQVAGVESTVSSDGMLTVTASRKTKEVNKALTEVNIPVTRADQVDKTSTKETLTQTVQTQQNEHSIPIQLEKSESTQVGSKTEETSIKTTESKTQQTTAKSNTSADNQSSNTSVKKSTSKNIMIPIDHSRGDFFQDSFFEKSRHSFKEAVNQVMKHMHETMDTSNPMNWYSNMRSHDRLEDMRAGTITTEGDNYKIILDVRDFEQGTIVVKALHDTEILIEGKIEKKTNGSSMMKSFRRRFVMPGYIKSELVTSARSSDGIMTITAPKQLSHFAITDVTKDVTNEASRKIDIETPFSPNVTSPNAFSPDAQTPDLSGPFSPVFSHDNSQVFSDNSTSKTTTSSDIQSKVEESIVSSNSSAKVEQYENVEKHSDSAGKNIEIQQVDSHDQKDISNTQTGVENGEKIVNIQYVDKNQSDIEIQNQQQANYTLIGEVKDLTDRNIKETVRQRKISGSQHRDISIDYEHANFPIVRRGPFFQDSFFQDNHQSFQSAVRKVLDRWVDYPSLMSSNIDSFDNFNSHHDCFNKTLTNYSSILDRDSFEDFACYKSLRNRSSKDENQAASINENKEDFKIVMDVAGFTEKDISIKATSRNEIVIEGSVESISQGSKSFRKFHKQFLLPGRVRMESVTSALSADDVLTITVPKNTCLPITDH